MDVFHKYNVEPKKSDPEEFITSDCLHRVQKQAKINQLVEVKVVLPLERQMGSGQERRF